MFVLIALLSLAMSEGEQDWAFVRYGVQLTRGASLTLELFASSTCDACGAFEVKLEGMIGEKKEDCRVVLVAQDRNEVRYAKHKAKVSKEWNVLPWASVQGAELSKGVGVVPTLHVLNERGELLDAGGYFTVMVLGDEAIPYWLGLRDGSRERVDYEAVHKGKLSAQTKPASFAKLQRATDL